MPANHQQTAARIFTPFGQGNSQQYPNLTASPVHLHSADDFSMAQETR